MARYFNKKNRQIGQATGTNNALRAFVPVPGLAPEGMLKCSLECVAYKVKVDKFLARLADALATSKIGNRR